MVEALIGRHIQYGCPAYVQENKKMLAFVIKPFSLKCGSEEKVFLKEM